MPITPLPRTVEIDDITHDSYESLIFALNGGKKTRIKVPFAKPIEIVPGAEFFALRMKSMFDTKIEHIRITHVRSGVAFYVSDMANNYTQENWFPLGCVYASRLEPVHYVSDLHPDFYEFVSYSEKVVVTYKDNQ